MVGPEPKGDQGHREVDEMITGLAPVVDQQIEEAPQFWNGATSPVRHRLDPMPMKRAIARVLVVDDEPDITSSLKRRLEHHGYEVIIAADGATATQQALHGEPDVIILDIGMPCGDGHTVAERIRSNPATVFTPIIYLTARTGELDRDRAVEARAYAYVTKPFRAEELLELIDNALSGDH